MGGWASAKLLLDLYGHFLPTESTGFADALDGTKRQYAAPKRTAVALPSRSARKKRARPQSSVAPRTGLEPVTRCLEGSCSIQLSYRGADPESSPEGARKTCFEAPKSAALELSNATGYTG